MWSEKDGTDTEGKNNAAISGTKSLVIIPAQADGIKSRKESQRMFLLKQLA